MSRTPFSQASSWTDEQRDAVERQLGHLVRLNRVPVKEECMKCIASEQVLEGTQWRRVKNLLYAKIQKARLQK